MSGWRRHMLDFLALKSLPGKLFILCVIITVIEYSFRSMVVKAPSEIVNNYVFKIGFNRHVGELNMQETGDYVREKCHNNKETNETQEIKGQQESEGQQEHVADHQQEAEFVLLKSSQAGVKNLFLCLPRRMATKAIFDELNAAYGFPCKGKEKSKGTTAVAGSCVRGADQLFSANQTVGIVFTRHPFDRVILDYRHQRHNLSGEHGEEKLIKKGQRTLLFSRKSHAWKKRRKGGNKFNEYVRKELLNKAHRKIQSVAQECQVCERHYDLVYKLDKGLESVARVLEVAGLNKHYHPLQKHNKTLTESKSKLLGQHTQRKFFSGMATEDIEKIYHLFREDFRLFNYNLNFYQNK